MAQVGRISGPLLQENLLRKGTTSPASLANLSFRNTLNDTQLLYLDVNNNKIGVNTGTPSSSADINVSGTTRTTDLIADSANIDGNSISINSNNLDITGSSWYLNAPEAIVLSNLETSQFYVTDNIISTKDSNTNIDIRPIGTGTVESFADLNVSGSIHAQGNITFDGNVTIGDDSTVDTVNIEATIADNIIPDSNYIHDLGKNNQRWYALHTNLINGEIVTTNGVTVGGANISLRQGNIFYVSVEGDNANVGDHPQGPLETIEEAISRCDASTSGPVIIYVFPGVYQESLPLVLPDDVQIVGADMRNTIIVPDTSSQSEDVFHLNDSSTVANLTIKDFYYDSGNDKGYAFRFAPNAVITSRSPYIQNVTVITQGTTTSASDPRGFASGDAGKGALIDGAELDSASIEASMLFHSVTFICPGVDAVTMTNGVRVEWLNSFTYFANRGLYAKNGVTGRTTYDGSTVEYGAEVRSIGSASVYGNYGAVADGSDCLMYLIQHNFGYIGVGKYVDNDSSRAIQSQEVVELNSGQIHYVTTDHYGNFRIGDNFLIDFETGDASIDASSISTDGITNLVITDGTNESVLTVNKVQTGNVRFTVNNIDTITGALNITPANEINIPNDVNISNNLDIVGDLNFDGSLNLLGNEASDTLKFNVNIDQNLNPNTTESFGLGSSTKEWANIHIDSAQLDDLIFSTNFISTLTSNSDLELRANGTGDILIPSNDVQIDNNLTVSGDTDLTGFDSTSVHTLDNPNPYSTSTSDYFSRSVAISGNRAIVGAYLEDDAGGSSSGKAYIFDVTTGRLAHTLDNPNAYSTSTGDYFGWTVGISGDRAIVGAHNEDDAGGASSGKAYIYALNVSSVSITDVEVRGDFSSPSVEYIDLRLAGVGTYDRYTGSGDNAVYSPANGDGVWLGSQPLTSSLLSIDYAPSGNVNFSPTGMPNNYWWQVKLKLNIQYTDGTSETKDFEFGASNNSSGTATYNPQLLHTLDNSNTFGSTSGDNFGYSVAISGDYAIVGAPYEDDGGGQSGTAYIFDVTTGGLRYTLDNPNAYSTPVGDYFGFSVAIDGDRAIVSSFLEDDINGSASGAAYIFDVTNGSFLHTLINPNASQGDYFGRSVAISGDYAIVGAYLEDESATLANSGKAYIFDVTTGSLVHTLDNPNPYGTPVGDYFGWSVGISGDRAIVCAQAEDDAGGLSSGKAYIFDVTTGDHLYTLDNPNAYATSATDAFGIDVAIDANNVIVGAYQEDDDDGAQSGKAYIYNLNLPPINLNVTGTITQTGNRIQTGNYSVNNLNVSDVLDVSSQAQFEEILFDGNVITTTSSNADLELRASGIGNILLQNDTVIENNLSIENLTTTSTVNLGGQVSVNDFELTSGIEVKQNYITTTQSNADLELRASGSGNITISNNFSASNNFTVSGNTTLPLTQVTIIPAIEYSITLGPIYDAETASFGAGGYRFDGGFTFDASSSFELYHRNISGEQVGDYIRITDPANADFEAVVQIATILSSRTYIVDVIYSTDTTYSNSGNQLRFDYSQTATIIEAVPGSTTYYTPPVDLNITGTLTHAGNYNQTGDYTIAGSFSVDDVQVKDNFITTTASNTDLELRASGTGNVIVDSNDVEILQNLTVSGATDLQDTAITNTVTHTGNRTQTGNLDIAGEISNGNILIEDNFITTTTSNSDLELRASGIGEILVPDGKVVAQSGLTVNGTTTIKDTSINGEITSFSNIIQTGNYTISGELTVDDVLVEDNFITTVSSDADLELRASGTGEILIPNNNLHIVNNSNVQGTTSLQGTTITGNLNMTGGLRAQTGDFNLYGELTVDNVYVEDNFITTTAGDLILSADGPPDLIVINSNDVTVGGSLTVNDAVDIDALTVTGNITQTGNRTQVGNLSIAGELSIDSVYIEDNFVTTSDTDADLDLRASGTGNVIIPSNDVQIDNNLTVSSTTDVQDLSITGTLSLTGNLSLSRSAGYEYDTTSTNKTYIREYSSFTTQPISLGRAIDTWIFNVQFYYENILLFDIQYATDTIQTGIGQGSNGPNYPGTWPTYDTDYVEGSYTYDKGTIQLDNPTEKIYQIRKDIGPVSYTQTGNLTITQDLDVGSHAQFEEVLFDGNVITTTTSNADLELRASGTGNVIFNEDLIVDNNLFTASITTGNITINKDLVLDEIVIPPSIIEIDDNFISTKISNADLDLRANGSGIVYFPSNNIEINNNLTVNSITDLQNITITGNVVQTGNRTQTGNLDIAGEISNGNILIEDNFITTTNTNSDLELRANGTGEVVVDSQDTVTINNNLFVDGTMTYQGALTINGNVTLQGNVQDGSLNVTENFEVVGKLDISKQAQFEEILVDDNVITTTSSNADLELRASGTGEVLIPNNNVQVDNNLSADSISASSMNIDDSVSLEILELSTDIQFEDNVITTTNSNSNLELKTQGSSSVYIDGVEFTGTSIGTNALIDSTLTDITFDVGSNLTTISGTGAFKIPVGNNSNRNLVSGSIRFNSQENVFEGYGNTVINLGGVRSANNLTSLTAHPTNNTINMQIAGTDIGSVDKDGLNIHGMQVDDILFDGLSIGTNVSNSELELRTVGTGAILIDNIKLKGNDITQTQIDTNIQIGGTGQQWVIFEGNHAVKFPSGTTLERPTNPQVGQTRHNSTLGELETWTGTQWVTSAGEFENVSQNDMEEEAFVQTLIYG